MKRSVFLAALCAGVIAFAAGSCKRQEPQSPQGKNVITAVTSLFPLYDFARAVGKENVAVSLLLPPGVESHSFEPRPGDILKINSADLFIYTGAVMEPWVAKILQAMENKDLLVIDASTGIRLLQEAPDPGEKHHGTDPHIWLDLANAQHMVDTICEGLSAKDPLNRKFYTDNARSYKARLAELDSRYRKRALQPANTRLSYTEAILPSAIWQKDIASTIVLPTAFPLMQSPRRAGSMN